jgi:uncharacterized membrane protein (UPF0127 family)
VRDLLTLGVLPLALVCGKPVERHDTAARCIENLRAPPPPNAKPASMCPHDPARVRSRLASGTVSFPSARHQPVLKVEVARSPSDITRGLMYRTKLDADRGMLFSFRDERVREFWMKNTCVPLDMLFLAKDGTVVGILEQVPVLNDERRSIGCPAAYVLEANAGWSREHGVTPGMKASLQL